MMQYGFQWFYLAVFYAEYGPLSQSKNELYFPNFRQYFPNKVKKKSVFVFFNLDRVIAPLVPVQAARAS